MLVLYIKLGPPLPEWRTALLKSNNLGIFHLTGPSHEVDPALWDRTMAVNARGIFLTSRAEMAQMIKQEPLPTHDGRPGNRGAVVSIASNLGLISRTGSRETVLTYGGPN